MSILKEFIKKSPVFAAFHRNLGYERAVYRKDLFPGSFPKRITDKQGYKNLEGDFQELKQGLPELGFENSIAGWVPFVRNRTKVIFWHFYSLNYGLRRKFLVRISLIRNAEIVYQKSFSLLPFSIKEVDVTELFDGADGTSVSVEFFHPYIRKDHGGHSGRLRFWGKYVTDDEYQATVHSSPVDMLSRFLKPQLVSRTVNSDLPDKKEYFDLASGVRINDSEIMHNGYLVSSNAANISCWHSTSTWTKDSENEEYFYIPDIQGIDLEFYYPKAFIGLEGKPLTFEFLRGDGELAHSATINLKNPKIRLSEICDDLDGTRTRYLRIRGQGLKDYISFAYIHGGNLLDGLHALRAPTDIGNCLKFLHFPRENESVESILFFLNPKLSKGFIKDKLELKLRILLDNGNEFVKNLMLDTDEPLIEFRPSDISKDIASQDYRNGIFILQTLDINLQGALLTITRSKGRVSIAIDHLTGA